MKRFILGFVFNPGTCSLTQESHLHTLHSVEDWLTSTISLPHVSVPMHPPGSGSAGTKQPWKVKGFIRQPRELQQKAIGGQLVVSLLYRVIKSTKLLAWHKTHLTAVYLEKIFFPPFLFFFFLNELFIFVQHFKTEWEIWKQVSL